jgi:hypothetical protein
MLLRLPSILFVLLLSIVGCEKQQQGEETNMNQEAPPSTEPTVITPAGSNTDNTGGDGTTTEPDATSPPAEGESANSPNKEGENGADNDEGGEEKSSESESSSDSEEETPH